MEKQMYQRAEICFPRKKKVLGSFHSNTFRIFDETLPDHLDPADVYHNYKYPTRDPKEYELLKSHNSPHPLNAKFIRTNVRFLNEPIAYIETRHTMEEQCHRLLTRGVDGVRHIPESSGAAVPLGRDSKPTELRENRCEREREKEKEERDSLSSKTLEMNVPTD